MGIAYAAAKLRHYLLHWKVTFFTKSTAVTLMMNKLEPPERLMKWIISLQEFDYTLQSKPPKLQGLNDCICELGGVTETDDEWETDHLRELLRVDVDTIPEWYTALATYLSTLETPSSMTTPEKRKLRLQALKFALIGATLYRRGVERLY